MHTKPFLLFLFITLTIHCFSQKGRGPVLNFKYRGQSFQIYTGTKISLSKGLNADGSFECASREKVLRQRESYRSTTSNYGTNRDTYVNTGEKEYLPKQYAQGTVTVLKVKYLEKLDEYRLVLGTPEGEYNFYLQHGLKNGEVIAINGVKVPEAVVVNEPGNSASTPYEIGAVYAAQLKNGSSVTGTLRETSGNNFKIETADKNVFVFAADEITTIKKAGADNTAPVSDGNTAEFEIVKSEAAVTVRRDTTPLGCFANNTDLSFLLVNEVDYAYSAKLGFSVANTSGYLFKNIFFLGGGISYTGCLSDSIKYHLISFEANQRLYPRRNKKISPFLSLHERVATTLKSISTSNGAATSLGADIGANFLIGKKFSITPYVGYNIYFLNRVPVERKYINTTYTTYEPSNAHYFVFGVSLGFRN